MVSFDSPRNGAYVSASPSLVLTVSAHDPDGSIVRTVFLDSTDSIAGVSAPPYTIALTGVKPGVHTYFAQVFDTTGAFTVAATTVTVIAGDGNIVTNPQFDDSLNGWAVNFSNGAAGVVTTSNQGLSGAHAARFTLSNGGAANWYALLSQTIGMSAHQTLTISFKAKASKAKQMQVVLQRMASPWDYYWSQTVALTAQAQTFGPFVFTPTETANTMFKFFVGGDTTTVWLDSIVAAVDLQSGVSPHALESEAARSEQTTDQFTTLVDHGVLRVFFARPGRNY